MKYIVSLLLVYHSLSNAFTVDYELIQQAFLVRNNAQAPYSNYYVGSAVRSQQGCVYKGCNVERCSYTQTTHAEQNAIDNMIAQEGPVKITAVAVVAAPSTQQLEFSDFANAQVVFGNPYSVAPCGHCRQIIWENSLNDPNVVIYLVNVNNKTIYVTTIGELLPCPFGPCDLGITYNNKK
jgi:cytidine deaminase